MDDIIALVSLVSKQKVKQIEIISENVALSKTTSILYNGVLEGHFKTDEDAIARIYGSGNHKESYKKLKYRLKQRLINTLFFIDIQSYSKNADHKAKMRNAKNLAAIFILSSKNRIKTTIKLSEITLKSALKFEMTSIIVLLLPRLVTHYGVFNYNNKKYSKYLSLLKYHQRILNAENLIQEYYVEFAQRLLKSKQNIDLEQLIKIEESYLAFREKYKGVESYEYNVTRFSTDYFLYMLKLNYDKLNDVCLEALAYLKKKNGFSLFPHFDFNLKFSVVHIYFKRYEEAIICLDKCDDLVKGVGSYNWFIIRSYKLLAYILKKDYEIALPLVSEVTNNKKFRSFYDQSRQQWLVKEAYFQFLIGAGKVDTEKFPNYRLRDFKLNRFLNDVDLMIKDKHGLNIPVEIIEVLFLFLEDKRDLLEIKLSALRQYNYRYLRKKQRSFSFIKMLCSIPEYEYNTERIKKRMSKYRQQLRDNPMELTEQEIQIEIIPYEDLWEMVMEMIGNEA